MYIHVHIYIYIYIIIHKAPETTEGAQGPSTRPTRG